jgi:hypothetical protein
MASLTAEVARMQALLDSRADPLPPSLPPSSKPAAPGPELSGADEIRRMHAELTASMANKLSYWPVAGKQP